MNQELNMFFMVNGNKFPSESMPVLMKSLENTSLICSKKALAT